MRSPLSHLFSLLSVLLLVGCESTPKVGVDYNPQYAFAGKTRFAVVRPESTGANDLVSQRLAREIENSLEAKGYTIVAPPQAELFVSFYVTTQNKVDVRTYNSGYGYRHCWDPLRCAAWARPEVDVKYYNEGSLLIDVIDPASKTLEWRGTTSKRLPSKASPAERDKLANEVVGAILAQYPPGSP